MLKVAVAGCTGKMGKALVQAIMASDDMVLTAASVSARHALDADVGTLAGGKAIDLFPVHDLSQVVDRFDCLIDFTTPEVTLAHVALCQAKGKKMVIGTTGLSAEQKQRLIDASKNIPILFAPNTSIGVSVVAKLIKETAALLQDKCPDLHIAETHHRYKKDAPSGTSLKFEETLRETFPTQPITHSSARLGEVIGDHSISFALNGETIEIKHHAYNRAIYANGALHAARWLQHQSKGLYAMADTLLS